jgi:hypothetical protein
VRRSAASSVGIAGDARVAADECVRDEARDQEHGDYRWPPTNRPPRCPSRATPWETRDRAGLADSPPRRMSCPLSPRICAVSRDAGQSRPRRHAQEGQEVSASLATVRDVGTGGVASFAAHGLLLREWRLEDADVMVGLLNTDQSPCKRYLGPCTAPPQT